MFTIVSTARMPWSVVTSTAMRSRAGLASIAASSFPSSASLSATAAAVSGESMPWKCSGVSGPFM